MDDGRELAFGAFRTPTSADGVVALGVHAGHVGPDLPLRPPTVAAERDRLPCEERELVEPLARSHLFG